MRLPSLAGWLTALLAAAAIAPSPARACAALFQPADGLATVTDHRMAIALSDEQTTWWDQIQYSGRPGDFVWVLPTPSAATIQLASQAFFDDLESGTAPTIFAALSSSSDGGGAGCAFGAGGEAALRGPVDAQSDVTVLHTGDVGPYESATVGSDDTTALLAWLDAHGYAIPDEARPTIAYYVAKGWVWNLLRLKPDATTSQMQPVRVIVPGRVATLPLRMAAIGAGDRLGLLLWVIAEQRYATAGFDTVTLDESALRWSTTSNRSSYRELFAAELAAHPHGAFVTEFAGPLDAIAWSGADEDLALARTGLAAAPRLTRLRTAIAPSLLVDDLTLTPSPTDAAVASAHYLQRSQTQAAPLALLGGSRSPMLATVAALALWYALRRRRGAI